MLQIRERFRNNYLQIYCAGNFKQTARVGIKMLTIGLCKHMDKALWHCNHDWTFTDVEKMLACSFFKTALFTHNQTRTTDM